MGSTTYWLDIRRAQINRPVDYRDRSLTTIVKCNMAVENPEVSLTWVSRHDLRLRLSIKFPRRLKFNSMVIDYEFAGIAGTAMPPVQLIYFDERSVADFSVVTIEDESSTRTGSGKRELLCFRSSDIYEAQYMTVVWNVLSERHGGAVLNQFGATIQGTEDLITLNMPSCGDTVV